MFVLFGRGLKDDVDDNGISKLRSHLGRYNGAVVMVLTLPGNYHSVTEAGWMEVKALFAIKRTLRTFTSVRQLASHLITYRLKYLRPFYPDVSII